MFFSHPVNLLALTLAALSLAPGDASSVDNDRQTFDSVGDAMSLNDPTIAKVKVGFQQPPEVTLLNAHTAASGTTWPGGFESGKERFEQKASVSATGGRGDEEVEHGLSPFVECEKDDLNVEGKCVYAEEYTTNEESGLHTDYPGLSKTSFGESEKYPSADKRRLRFVKRRLRFVKKDGNANGGKISFDKRRLRFVKKDSHEIVPEKRRLRFVKRRWNVKGDNADDESETRGDNLYPLTAEDVNPSSKDVPSEEGGRLSPLPHEPHVVKKRSVPSSLLSDLESLNLSSDPSQMKRTISINQPLHLLTYRLMKEELERRQRLRKKLLEIGKRSEPSFTAENDDVILDKMLSDLM